MDARQSGAASPDTSIEDWKTICCAIDLLGDPTPLVKAAADLSRFLGARLIVLHAARRGYSPYPGAGCPACDRELDYWKGRAVALGACHVTVETVVEEPSAAILGFARDHDVDVIMMGPPAAGRLRRLLRRSVVGRVTHGAPCTVLLSRSVEAGARRPSSTLRETVGRRHLRVVK